MPDTSNCESVSADCPVEGTIYGYAPNLAASIAFCALFSAFCIIQLVQTIKWRMWSFGIAVLLGAFSEAAGYIGRILLYKNPYDSTGFEIQICTLTMGPAFWSAAIYLTLKHEVNVLGPEFSLKSKWYPYIFVTCDLISLSLQGAGGGLAATATTAHGSAVGSDVMLAGIVWQVVTLTVFVAMLAHFFLRVNRTPKHRLSVEAQKVLECHKFWVFCSGIALAFVTTYVRCVYRIAEMAGGWRNPIMQDEIGFIVFESVMCVIAVLALCVAHPGYWFTQMRAVKTINGTEDSILLQQKPGGRDMP